MEKPHVLITGVAGFIGSNLLNFLLENSDWKVTGIDNLSTGRKKNIEHQLSSGRFHFIEQDITCLNSLKEFDTVFHLAALPRIQPSYELISEHLNANVVQGVHLIELMIRDEHYPRMVYSSSSAIYGNPDQVPTPESEKIDCMNPYAFQKYEFEKYLDIISERYPLDYVHLRYFNPYGPGSFNPENKFNAYSSVVGIFLYRKQNGMTLKITGDGSQKRDFIHVMDVANANYRAAVFPDKLNTCFNIGKGKTLSIMELARLISDDFEFIPPRLGEADITLADISKAKKVLDWTPVRSLPDYIENVLKKHSDQ